MRNEHIVELPVAEVTLFEDRARVVRRGSVSLGLGEHRLRIPNVAPVLVDKTLNAKGAVRVTNVTVARERVLHPQQERPEVGELWQAWEALSDRTSQLQERVRAAREAEGDLRLAQELAWEEIGEDAAWGSSATSRWSQLTRELREQRQRAAEQRLALEGELELAQEELRRLSTRVQSLLSPRTVLRADITVDVSVAQKGSAELQVSYTVPCAAWRPYHRAILRDRQLRLETDACVWQNTGEDWHRAQLYFSTERLSLGTEPPLLQEDVLTSRRRDESVQVETREQEIFTSGVEGTPAPAPELPGIDDGGEVLNLAALSLATVPSDGRPYRVHIGGFQTEAELQYLLRAEVTPAVVLCSRQRHTGTQPLLAGPVDLIRDSGFVGRTSVLYVAAGETFELGWGPDAHLRVHRRAEASKEDKGMLSSWRSQVHRVTLTLSNLGASPRRIAVRERIPVSEIDKVEIHPRPKQTTEAKRPNENGFVDWDVTLAPRAHQELTLAYEVRKHADVVG